MAGLNETTVKNHTHAKGEFVWDGDLPGFGLRCKPSGVKSFLVQYRPKGTTQTKRLTLGRHPVLKVEAARVMAMKQLAAIAEGADPSKERKDRIALRSDTLADAIELYLTKHCAALRSAPELRKLFAKYVTPTLGSRPRTQVTKQDIKAIMQAAIDGATRGPGEVTANRVLKRVRELYQWLISEDYVAADPTIGIKLHDEVSRDRVLDDRELRIVWKATETLAYPFRHVAQLLILSGQRRTEVGEMKLVELTIDAKLWTLPRDRSKTSATHEVPLSDAAWAVVTDAIKERTKLAGNQPWSHLFVRIGDAAIADYSDLKEAIDKAIAAIVKSEGGKPLPHWTLHDLRRSFRTRLGGLGVQPHISELTIGHQRGGIVAVYDRETYRDEKRDAAERFAAMLSRLASGATNVVQLRA